MNALILRGSVFLWIALLIAGGVFVQSLKSWGRAQERWSYEMIRAIVSAVSSYALATHDDLLLEKLAGQMIQREGVVEAMVLDSGNRVRIHSNPAKVGSTEVARAGWTIPVPGAPGGSLRWILIFSNAFWRKNFHPALAMGFSVVVFIGLGFVRLLVVFYKRLRVERGKRKSLLLQIAAQSKAVRAERALSDEKQFRMGLWLEALVRQFPKPMIVLDGRQRVLWVHPDIQPCLTTGVSWHDVTSLAGIGPTLARSLEHPGGRFETTLVPLAEHAIVVTESLSPLSETLTWIHLSKAPLKNLAEFLPNG